jgi:hypothetical protein
MYHGHEVNSHLSQLLCYRSVRRSFRPSPCLECLERIAFSGTNPETTSFRAFAFSLPTQFASLSQWNEPNFFFGKPLLSIFRQQVFWNVLQVRLLSRRSQLAVVTEVVDFGWILFKIPATMLENRIPLPEIVIEPSHLLSFSLFISS